MLGQRKALLKWYDASKRALPWRENTDPYRVLVSELMLQQTQVKTVLPYYSAFLKKFPTAKKLAAASEQDVLAAWAGLGYYRRARFLHTAAKAVAGPGFPRTGEGLQKLPGIGSYTAAALGSISFGLPLAVVDGNVIRVVARLLAYEGPATTKEGLRVIGEFAAALLDPRRPGDSNQAVMELGALVCSPRAPLCGACPLSKYCAAFAQGRPEAFPKLPEAAAVTRVRKVVALVGKGDQVLAAPRGGGGRMEGLWHFPELELKAADSAANEAARLAGSLLKAMPRALGPCGVVKHTVTRYRISIEAFRFEGRGLPKAPWAWVSREALKSLPLASAEKKLSAFLEAKA